MSLPKLEAREVTKSIARTNWGLYNAVTGEYITGQLTEEEAKGFIELQEQNKRAIERINEIINTPMGDIALDLFGVIDILQGEM